MFHGDRHPATPVVFGEVLFDHFTDGSRVLGGAPFNVAWHLHGFGHEPLFISAVGADDEGAEIMDRMRSWGLRTEGVQIDRKHPTGSVVTEIVEGEPVFDIRPEQAYDHIAADEAVGSTADVRAGLLYHGTLALRVQSSREAAAALEHATSAPRFVDLNLRAPWWTRLGVEACLRAADWLKLNRDELGVVMDTAPTGVEGVRESALALAGQHEVGTVIVTLGVDGALIVRNGESWVGAPDPLDPGEVVDTVGAGDAFSAVACMGLLMGWEPQQILARGNAFGGELCRVRGATTQDRNLYERHLEAWRGSDE